MPSGAVPEIVGREVAARAADVIAGIAGGVRSTRSDWRATPRSLPPATTATRTARVPAARSAGTANDQVPSRDAVVSPATMPSIVIRSVCRAGAVPENTGRRRAETFGDVIRGAEVSNRIDSAAEAGEMLPARSRAVAENVNGPPGTGTAAPRTGGMLAASNAQVPSAAAVTA